MTKAEKAELFFIPVSGITFWVITPFIPEQLSLGHLFLYASALLLFQSLVRDLLLLNTMKSRESSSSTKSAQCMCIESTVGMTGIVLGALLLGIGVAVSISMTEWYWSLMAMVVTGSGFLIKDYVFEWNPWRIRQDKDHMNIIVKWKA